MSQCTKVTHIFPKLSLSTSQSSAFVPTCWVCCLLGCLSLCVPVRRSVETLFSTGRLSLYLSPHWGKLSDVCLGETCICVKKINKNDHNNEVLLVEKLYLPCKYLAKVSRFYHMLKTNTNKQKQVLKMSWLNTECRKPVYAPFEENYWFIFNLMQATRLRKVWARSCFPLCSIPSFNSSLQRSGMWKGQLLDIWVRNASCLTYSWVFFVIFFISCCIKGLDCISTLGHFSYKTMLM